MISTRAKGRRAEKEVATMFKENGYVVELVKGSSKWNKQVDIFGCFDLLAMNTEELVGVQVKCNRTGGALKKLKEFRTHPSNFRKLVVVKVDRKGFRFYEVKGDVHKVIEGINW